MIQTLALLSMALLMLAGAVELWWGTAARRQARKSLAHIEQSLAGTVDVHRPGPPTLLAATQTKDELRSDALMLRAGLPAGWRMPVILSVAGLAVVLVGWWRVGSVWMVPLLLGAYAAGVWLWLRMRMEKLQKQFVRQLPDFLDGIVRMSNIGNSLPMAFQATLPSIQPPLRVVLDRAMQSVRAGLDLDRALQLASKPYRLEELELLHVVLGTGMRMGGRADLILQRMSDFMRDLSQARQELRAITAETRMSAWVIGLLPVATAVFMTITNPAFFTPMFTQPLGHKFLLMALGMETLGAVLLYRLARSL
ncbi:type II secretion system F family protein [Dyella caseinilytica]|uniref:Type II secretion system F family protein n=1 Tax=Dyella caseinilytica TaxID=1849581 RepID=A0ABX7GY95_9GAMM|nr:type II secretion system F family protein [Dyella caseinilytica]QRN55463.1 type II secretion system F family protein [Dyella caseinilytica]GGA01886.1 fimbriae-related outer membrane protein [Dyella caseinilytica]